MTSYLRRLLRAGAAYQLADAVSKVVALALLPVYTRHLTRADYGTAELLLTRMLAKIEGLCEERERLKKEQGGPTKGRVLGGRSW